MVQALRSLAPSITTLSVAIFVRTTFSNGHAYGGKICQPPSGKVFYNTSTINARNKSTDRPLTNSLPLWFMKKANIVWTIINESKLGTFVTRQIDARYWFAWGIKVPATTAVDWDCYNVTPIISLWTKLLQRLLISWTRGDRCNIQNVKLAQATVAA